MTEKLSAIGWGAFITGSRRDLLPSLGWQIDRFGHNQQDVNLRARVPDWEERTWAERTFLQAAYGFRKDGAIVLTLEDLRNSQTLEPLLHGSLKETPQGTYPEPGWALPGADTRIRQLLKDHTSWEWMKARDDAVAWMGPDDSIILTCPEGWGIPGLVEREPGLYCEFNENRNLCPWQLDYGQQPGWSVSPPSQPRDGLRPLGNGWEQEFSSTEYGITRTRFRRGGNIMGESVDETDDGQHLLRWSRKHSRKLLTETTNPLGQPGWTITVRNPGTGQGLVTANSKRNGTTEKVGSALSAELVRLLVHEYVRSTAHRKTGEPNKQ